MARPWACDPSRWQREARGQSLEVHPAHPAAFLAAPPEATEPDTADLLTEPVECRVVVRPAVVAVVTRQHAGVPAMLRGHRGVHQPPGFLAQRLQLARQTLALSLVLHDEPAVLCPPAVVGEPEEGEAHRRRSPRCRRARAGSRPNSISRVLSSCSAKPKWLSRSLRAQNICRASASVSKPI